MYVLHDRKKNLSSTRIVRLVGDILNRAIVNDSMIEKMGKKKRKEESSYSLFVDLVYRCVWVSGIEECL